MRLWSQCSTNLISSLIGKARRKDKDVSAVTPSQSEESKQYLHATMLECTTPEEKLREIVNLPEGLDYNEWLASHTLAFFDHINLLYGTVSEFCSMSGCPDNTGPCNRQYSWIDEKGKRCKLAAPQYIDYVMTFTQKTVNDESLFPTKFDKEFPVSFESIVRKIIKLLYEVLAHIYHSHFKEIVLLNLHRHLNCIFAHLVLFSDKFKLVERKEFEVLHDLAVALKLFPPHGVSESTTTSESDQPFVNTSAIIDNNSGSNNNGVITTQCRSISPLVEANHRLIKNERNLIKVDDNRNAISSAYKVATSVERQKCNIVCESQSYSEMNNRRSISASAVPLSSSDPCIPTTITRRSNSDRNSSSSSGDASSGRPHRMMTSVYRTHHHTYQTCELPY